MITHATLFRKCAEKKPSKAQLAECIEGCFGQGITQWCEKAVQLVTIQKRGRANGRSGPKRV